MRIDTIRVVNPAQPDTYMTINRDKFAPGHDLWHEQDEGFTPFAPPRQAFDPAERDLAVEILNRMVPAAFGLSNAEWHDMSGPVRLDMLRRFEMDRSVPVATPVLTVAKANGPRGLWYVMRGDQRASQGFRSEDEAKAEHERMGD